MELENNPGLDYEEERSVTQELTFEQFSEICSQSQITFTKELQQLFHLVKPDGSYSNLGLLFSDQCPYRIKIAVFVDHTFLLPDKHLEMTGSLIKQMNDAFKILNTYNTTRAEIIGLHRVETRSYPAAAIRNALINTVAHCNYRINSSILIRIFADRMEFINMGGLIQDITLDDIKLGVSVRRNPNLARMLHELKLFDDNGCGIKEMFDCYAPLKLKPRLEATPNAFKVTLPNVNAPKKRKYQKKQPQA